jgi:hypothetical protein
MMGRFMARAANSCPPISIGRETQSRCGSITRSHAGGEYDAYLPVVDPEEPLSAAELDSLLSADWGAGDIRADDDPWWAAYERQRAAIAEWEREFPEAAARYPRGSISARAPDEERATWLAEQRAAWDAWNRRFPEAAARRAALSCSVDEFIARGG